MTVYQPAWLLPISAPPIRNGWVAVEGGRIVASGAAPAVPAGAVALAGEALLPALVNAHTHLELSWMRGQVSPATAMPAWVERLMALRRTVGHEPPAPIDEAVRFVRDSGTGLVGDITNTFAAYGALLDSGLSGCVFRELLGFRVEDGEPPVREAEQQAARLPASERLRVSVVPHAPYSVSPELLRAIAAASAGRIVSVHVAESAEEVEFLRQGTGAWRDLLHSLGAWHDSWRPPGCGAVEYLERFGLVSSRLLAVHGVQLTDPELQRLAAAGATVVTCPRSNAWTGAGVPPVARFYASGVRVAIGTDSLASVEDLNMFGELAAVRRAAPQVPARRILDSATRAGAEALGFGGDFGTLEAGRRAVFAAVRVPPDVTDVEEYLLSGIEPGDVRPLADPGP